VAYLLRTDGTRDGTRTVAGGYETGPYQNLTSFAGQLYFIAPAGQGHRRLWVTRGTASTTHLVRPKAFSGDASGLVAVAGRLYFTTRSGYELWSTDGSAGGERRIGGGDGWSWTVPGQEEPGSAVHMVASQGRAWFAAAREWTPGEDEDGIYRGDIWSTDGTLAGTRQETALDPDGSGSVWGLVSFVGGLWFGGSVDREDGLWRIDAAAT
jgi:ELWxxDGT repeat protein